MSLALNAICPYYTMFPLAFPLEHLQGLKPGSWVLDPFCGRGTTAFAARTLKLSSLGLDVNPVAVAAAQAKLVAPRAAEVTALAKKVLASPRAGSIPMGEFWSLAYHPNTLYDIVHLRQRLLPMKSRAAVALRAIILGALHGPQAKFKDAYLSNQMQRTFSHKPDYAVKFWMERGLKPRPVDVLAVIKERAERYYGEQIPVVEAQVRRQDARKPYENPEPFAAVVTSPPYNGMSTYVPDQWLRNWFLGGPAHPVYEKADQLSRGDVNDFAMGLAEVWRVAAKKCRPGAKLAIRFGAIHSRSQVRDPLQILDLSIAISDCGWRVRSVKDAGHAAEGRRQAYLMGKIAKKSNAVREIDMVCTLS
jgi:hypothetical protein